MIPGPLTYRGFRETGPWSHLTYLQQNATILAFKALISVLGSISVILSYPSTSVTSVGSLPEQQLVMDTIPIYVVSFRDQKGLVPRPDWSLQAV